MRYCDCCHTAIGNAYTYCPICGMDHRADAVCGEGLYPKTRRNVFREMWRRIFTWCLVAMMSCAVIVNLCVGGRAWSLYVLLGGYVLYTAALSSRLVETSLIGRIVSAGVATAFLLWGIQYMTQSGSWATDTVIPLELLATILACAALYFARPRARRNHFLPPALLMCGAVAAAAAGVCGYIPLGWPLLTLGSVSAGLILVTAILFWKPLCAQMKKKFYH